MDGRSYVEGNLGPQTIPPQLANKKAEWNAFWNPYAVSDMFELLSEVKIFPLDITDQVPVTKEFMEKLKIQSHQYNLSKFVYEISQPVANESYYDMWNTLTTRYLGAKKNEIYDLPKILPLTIHKWGDKTQGWIHDKEHCNKQAVFLNLKNRKAFYNYVLDQLKNNAPL